MVEIDKTEIRVDGGIIGVDGDSLLQHRYSLIVAFEHVQDRTLRVEVLRLGIHLNSLVEVADSLIGMTTVDEVIDTVLQEPCLLGVFLDALVQNLIGGCAITLVDIRLIEELAGMDSLVVAVHQFAEHRDGCFVLSPIKCHAGCIVFVQVIGGILGHFGLYLLVLHDGQVGDRQVSHEYVKSLLVVAIVVQYYAILDQLLVVVVVHHLLGNHLAVASLYVRFALLVVGRGHGYLVGFYPVVHTFHHGFAAFSPVL